MFRCVDLFDHSLAAAVAVARPGGRRFPTESFMGGRVIILFPCLIVTCRTGKILAA
jgi:hypothetical protein